MVMAWTPKLLDLSCQQLLAEKPRKSGFLRWKKPSLLRQWSQMFVILHSGCVYIYDSECSKKTAKRLSLYGYLQVLRAGEIQSSEQPWAFKIVNNTQEKLVSHIFSAVSEDEMQDWIEKFTVEEKLANNMDSSYTVGRTFPVTEPLAEALINKVASMEDEEKVEFTESLYCLVDEENVAGSTPPATSPPAIPTKSGRQPQPQTAPDTSSSSSRPPWPAPTSQKKPLPALPEKPGKRLPLPPYDTFTSPRTEGSIPVAHVIPETRRKPDTLRLPTDHSRAAFGGRVLPEHAVIPPSRTVPAAGVFPTERTIPAAGVSPTKRTIPAAGVSPTWRTMPAAAVSPADQAVPDPPASPSLSPTDSRPWKPPGAVNVFGVALHPLTPSRAHQPATPIVPQPRPSVDTADGILPEAKHMAATHYNGAKDKARDLLREIGDGAYLIRPSTTVENGYTLCVCISNSVRQFQIHQTAEGYYISTSNQHEPFPNLYELVKYYHEHLLTSTKCSTYLSRPYGAPQCS